MFGITCQPQTLAVTEGLIKCGFEPSFIKKQTKKKPSGLETLGQAILSPKG